MCVCASAMFMNASHKADIHFYKDMHKNELHDYCEYIYPLSISKLREGYALSKCFSFSLYKFCLVQDIPKLIITIHPQYI